MTLKVMLSHAPNPDLPEGYWEEPVDPRKTKTVEVATLAEAWQACRDYIERNHLGSGNWTGGQVFEGSKRIASVSFNGRVWDTAGKEIDLTKVDRVKSLLSKRGNHA